MKLKPGMPLQAAMRFGPNQTIKVGRLAMDRTRALFEYSPEFVESRLQLSPFFPQPSTGVLIEPKNASAFSGLHGVFADSLPDAWGRLLIERRAQAHGVSFFSLNPLDLLGVVGSRGPGALVYAPELESDGAGPIDLDVIAAQAIEVADGGEPVEIDQLARLGGPSGGARPKILVGLGPGGVFVPGDRDLEDGFEHWIVKFRSSQNDSKEIGPIEAAYADMARAAGLNVSPTRLLIGRRDRYFATKRFDRLAGNRRIHMLSATALLETAWDGPFVDYDGLLRLTRAVTRNQAAVEAMFRRMIFNVLAHNRDDHTNQHAFLMDENGEWGLAPAYDLTFNLGPGNEHYLAVGRHGGDDIERVDIESIGKAHHIHSEAIGTIMDEVSTAVADFPRFAALNDVTEKTTKMINDELQRGLMRVASAPVQRRGRTRG